MTEMRNNESVKSKVINATVVAFFALFAILFILLSHFRLSMGIAAKYRPLITSILLVLTAAMLSLCLIFYFLHHSVAYRLTISIFLVYDLILLFAFCLLATGFLQKVNSVESFEEYLSSAGKWMDILFILLQYLQVVILPIPSFVTLVAGTAIFGAVKCFLYSFFSILLGSITAFFIGRLLGYKAVAWMVGKENLDKWLKKIKGKDYVILTAMFLLPFFPDDVLCLVAGLSTMTPQYFILMNVVSRAVAIATTCFSIDLIPFNTWWGILCWIVIAAFIAALFILYYKNQDKLQKWFNSLIRKRRSKRKRVKQNRAER